MSGMTYELNVSTNASGSRATYAGYTRKYKGPRAADEALARMGYEATENWERDGLGRIMADVRVIPGMCERCARNVAITTWAGTGQDLCWPCVEVKRSQGMG